MYQRNIAQHVQTAMRDTPVILLNGARQTGKSTLAKEVAGTLGGDYVTLDDATVLAGAIADPAGFLRVLGGMTVIDEIQKAPGLFPAIKKQVDIDRRPARYLLTGSANVLLLPRVSESLAGRMEIVTLWPLSQGELRNRSERFIDHLFAPELPRMARFMPRDHDVISLLATGGYPEAVARTDETRRHDWFNSYLTAILQRDVRDLANIEGLTDLPRLLALLAARSSGLLNTSELSRSSTIAQTTLKRYLSLLQITFLMEPLLAWSANLSKRLIKAPKVHLIDTGLATHLTGHAPQRLTNDPTLLGNLLESLVVMELRKQLTWSKIRARIFHFRTLAGKEVDVVLEDARGYLVGVEVKAAASVSKKDFSGLTVLADELGKKFVRGVVLYTGDTAVAFGDKLIALPLSALWRMT
jgi:uncharacterized protein